LFEQRQHVARERITLAAGRQGLVPRKVVALARNDMAHAAARVIHVAAVPGNDVNMHMHHRLPRCDAGVEADVVAIGMQLFVELPLHDIDQLDDGKPFFLARGEPVGHESACHDQRVAWRNRIPVAKGERMGVRRDPLAVLHIEEDRHAGPRLPAQAAFRDTRSDRFA
jgi:hypothetical protein